MISQKENNEWRQSRHFFHLMITVLFTNCCFVLSTCSFLNIFHNKCIYTLISSSIRNVRSTTDQCMEQRYMSFNCYDIFLCHPFFAYKDCFLQWILNYCFWAPSAYSTTFLKVQNSNCAAHWPARNKGWPRARSCRGSAANSGGSCGPTDARPPSSLAPPCLWPRHHRGLLSNRLRARGSWGEQ